MSQTVTRGARALSWMSRGACRQADPELFFPRPSATRQSVRQVEAAKAVCGRCAVRANCLSYALEAKPDGIWGGTTWEERCTPAKRLFRRQASARSAEMASATLTGEDVTRAGHTARQQALPGRTG